jgi:hypothetical protein
MKDSLKTKKEMALPFINLKEKMLGRKEAAEFLGVEACTLATWACKKRYNLPSYKIGRHIKYRIIDLQKFIDERIVQ